MKDDKWTMENMQSRKHALTLLSFLLIAGAFLRLYNLNWGAPFYFHPDERNIASSISQLQFPNQLNPHFFAYGSLPLYIVFFLGLVINYFTKCHLSFSCSVSFEQAIILLRSVSAFLSILLIPLSFYTSEKLRKGAGLFTAALTAFSTGYIQFAHFGTVEMLLTFFSLLLFFCLLIFLENKQKRYLFFSGIILGILISTKISSLVLLILPFLVLLLADERISLPLVIKKCGQTGALVFLAAVVFLLTNPYAFLDFPSFHNSMNYESGVAFGTLPVFYTAEFFHTIPILFQLEKVFPFLLNPVLTLLFLIAFIWAVPRVIHEKKLLLLLSFLLIILVPQAVLFVKWTRYMVPTLPFIYLLVSVFIHSLKKVRKPITVVVVLISIVFGVSYFMTAFVEIDTRLQAADFAKTSIPSSSPILSEVYDLGITPFNDTFPNIYLFNTYELDNHNPEFTYEILLTALQIRDYIILPSQRVLKTRLLSPSLFPVGNTFYTELTQNKLGYEKMYQTPCSVFCEITYLGDPVNRFEETASVFDRPVVFIYKK